MDSHTVTEGLAVHRAPFNHLNAAAIEVHFKATILPQQ
jgi:hypothetical protein